MSKRKLFIAIHQLNLGGAQKALISALNAIDYSKNDVTLYVRKERLDLLPQVNRNISQIIVNRDNTKYYRKPYTVFLYIFSRINNLLKRSNEEIEKKTTQYIVKKQIHYEKRHYFSQNITYDVAISYIQGYTAKSVAQNIHAKRKVMFYHDSTDSMHELHCEVMKEYNKIYCVSKGAQEAVRGFYPQFADRIGCLENYVDAEAVRYKAKQFVPDYPKDKLILCTCGRITSVKGFDLAVGAAEILKKNGLSFKWYFVGDGADREKIEQLIVEKNLSNEIKITGLKDNPYPYIVYCDIYVQPSYEEAHPLSIIEAQILQKPIVSTATVGGKSIINDGINGIIAEICSESLAEKIQLLNSNKELQKSIVNNLAKVNYSKDYQRFRNDWKKLLEG